MKRRNLVALAGMLVSVGKCTGKRGRKSGDFDYRDMQIPILI